MARGVNCIRGLLVAASGFLCMHDHRPPGVSLNDSLTLGCKAVPLAVPLGGKSLCLSGAVWLPKIGFQTTRATGARQKVLEGMQVL